MNSTPEQMIKGTDLYGHIRNLNIHEQAEAITRHLVGIPSINGTEGEIRVVREIRDILSSFPYFVENPENLWLQKVEGDAIGRYNVFALVEGLPDSDRTILYHAHIDTVSVEDFGPAKQQAFSPDELENYFREHSTDPTLREEAGSGDWMFGRGAVDMKSGAAVHIANLLYFSEHRDELPGNVLLLCNGDEESEHSGMVGALDELNRLKEQSGFDFVSAINTDFITPLYEGDTKRYIYTGTAGKVLPCFHIYGREVHVGDTLAGIDPSYLAAKLTERIHNRYELTERIPGELVLPPTILHQRDTKEIYTVQTAMSSHVYFNYFIYEQTPNQVLQILAREAKAVCRETEQYFREQYEHFLSVTGHPARDLSWDVEVTTYEEYVDYLSHHEIDAAAIIGDALSEASTTDLRELGFHIVQALQEADPFKKPRIILFFAPPFLPHNYLRADHIRDSRIRQAVSDVLNKVSEETGEYFELKKFFPSLADGSFLSFHETAGQLEPLTENMPAWGEPYSIPFDRIRSLDIPSITMGVYGKDGHKWTERLYKPYSFGVLPGLIRKATVRLLEGEETK